MISLYSKSSYWTENLLSSFLGKLRSVFSRYLSTTIIRLNIYLPQIQGDSENTVLFPDWFFVLTILYLL